MECVLSFFEKNLLFIYIFLILYLSAVFVFLFWGLIILLKALKLKKEIPAIPLAKKFLYLMLYIFGAFVFIIFIIGLITFFLNCGKQFQPQIIEEIFPFPPVDVFPPAPK